MKRYVRARNKTYKLPEVEILLRESVQDVTPTQWSNYVAHVMKEELKYWDLDNLMEEIVEPFIINVGEDSSDSETDFSDNESEANDIHANMDDIVPLRSG